MLPTVSPRSSTSSSAHFPSLERTWQAAASRLIRREQEFTNAVRVATLKIISHNLEWMVNRIFRVVMLLFWLELGLVLVLAPWSDIWEANFFLYQYPALGFFLKNPFFRGGISGLGVLNVFLSIEAFRHRTTAVANRI
jgi:hypothetical protein